MDDSLLSQFQSTFLLSGQVHDPRTVHPHYTQYKAKREGYGSQETRRKRFLEEQQTRRRDFADLARKIAEGDEMSDESEGEMEEGAVDEVDAKPKGKEKSKKDRYPYRNQIMLSEWLVDTPTDLASNWLAVVVPVGRRSLVVAARKTTYAYSRAGAMLNHFHSLLPGGSICTHRQCRDYCILDCVFYEATQTYYILDIMCWRGDPIYDSDLEFRVFWKEQKCSECAGISTYSRGNPLPFQNLAYHPCTKDGLGSVLSSAPSYQVDGVLFIHKRCRYILGGTPLALWLKPHMIPDLLGIAVSADFLAQSPAIVSAAKRTKEKMDTSGSGSASGKGQWRRNEDKKLALAMEADGKLSETDGKASPTMEMGGKQQSLTMETSGKPLVTMETSGKPLVTMETGGKQQSLTMETEGKQAASLTMET